MEILQQISDALQKGEDVKAGELTQQAIDEKLPPKTILDDGLIAGMSVIGDKFRKHEIFLPEVLLAARAMYAGMDLLKPLFLKNEVPMIGKVVLGTVQGDLHDIGKNLVGIMLKGAGFEVIDLGKDVPAEKFIEAAQQENAGVIGMSTLLTTTAPAMKKVIELIKDSSLNGKVKTVVGGAPISKEIADQMGADAYGFDAGNAVDVVKKLVGAA
ncbi:B12-binding domain-containing protein [candidate division KSB1 bacterium]